MNRFVLLSAACAAIAVSPAAMAKEDGADSRVQGASSGEASPARLISWDGDFELMKTSRQLRVWRSHLAYRLDVNAQGAVTDCELTETFRMKRVADALCDVLSEHHTFEPALDAGGNPVEGSYASRISYREMAERL